MRTVVVLDETAEDIEHGRRFYDDQEAGIGHYFADSLLSDIESLALYHGIHSRHFGLYRMLAHRFPFGVYYRETRKETQVLSVLDLQSDPAWIRKELAWRGV